MKNYVLMRFKGLLQSWGNQTMENKRTTYSFPTRSAVVGLIGNALGIDRYSEDKLSEIDNSITGYAVCVNKDGGRLTDFHTVQGLAKAKGGTKETNITRRDYLVCSDFSVLIEGSKETLEVYAQALCRPKRILYLGRKTCLPSCRIFDRFLEASDIQSASEMIKSKPDNLIYLQGNFDGPKIQIRDKRIYNGRAGGWYMNSTYTVVC